MSAKAALLDEQCTAARSHSTSNGDEGIKPELVTDAAIRQRLSLHSTDLHDYYFSMRRKAMIGCAPDNDDGLSNFSSGNLICTLQIKISCTVLKYAVS